MTGVGIAGLSQGGFRQRVGRVIALRAERCSPEFNPPGQGPHSRMGAGGRKSTYRRYARHARAAAAKLQSTAPTSVQRIAAFSVRSNSGI